MKERSHRACKTFSKCIENCHTSSLSSRDVGKPREVVGCRNKLCLSNTYLPDRQKEFFGRGKFLLQAFHVILEITRLNMLFIPTLPVKVEFNQMLRMLGNTKNAKQGLGRLGG